MKRKGVFSRSSKKKTAPLAAIVIIALVLCALLFPDGKLSALINSAGVTATAESTASFEASFESSVETEIEAVPPSRPVGEIPEGEDGFFIYFIDVGQADCAVIYCDGSYLLIDAGNVSDGELVASRLDELGADKLEYVVETHAHEDHAGGLAVALSGREVGTFYAPEEGSDNGFFLTLTDFLTEREITPVTPSEWDTFALGSARCVFLSPTEDEFSSLNDTSLIVHITYKQTKFLFMADASTDLERSVIESGADVSADLIKIGHHGSASSTSYRLLYESQPRYAVISVGKGNRYGHPDEDTLSILRDADVTVYRTDECGDIKVISDGKALRFETGRTPREGNQ